MQSKRSQRYIPQEGRNYLKSPDAKSSKSPIQLRLWTSKKESRPSTSSALSDNSFELPLASDTSADQCLQSVGHFFDPWNDQKEK